MYKISVMGSVGKSTTAHALAWYLSNFGSSYFGGLGNYPKHIIKSLKFCNLKKAKYNVFEVSGATFMKGTKETIGERSNRLIEPDVLLFTSMAPAHYAWGESLEELARRKSQGFKKIKPGGILILNVHSPEYETLKGGCVEGVKLFTYGLDESCDIRYDKTEDEAIYKGLAFPVIFPAFFSTPEKLNLIGCMAAVFASVPLLSLPKFFDFTNLPLLDGRGKFYRDVTLLEKRVNLISDCYNSNPISLQNGLLKFSRVKTPGRRIAVICQMKDLGSLDLIGHQTVLKTALGQNFDILIAVGEKYQSGHGGYINCTIDELNNILQNLLVDGDTLYFKGSHMYGLWSYVNDIVGNKNTSKAKYYRMKRNLHPTLQTSSSLNCNCN